MSSYTELSELTYLKVFDPWGSLPTHKRYALHERLWALVCAIVPGECGSIVEHGCGLGKLTYLLAAQNPSRKVMGLDVSPTAIARARRLFPECTFDVADVETWRPDAPIDLAILTGPYHHVADRVGLLHHIRSYLVSRGYILIVYLSDSRLEGTPGRDYPDLRDEIFNEFAPVELVVRLAMDAENGEQGAWRLYLGQKR